MRDKDRDLAERCELLLDASLKAKAWVASNRELVGNRTDALIRSISKGTVEARKFARAARRPMSVGVFGPSQHGKSFLIGTVLKGRRGGEGSEVDGCVRFGNENDAPVLDFQTQVNPQGDGKETTGLVTRFTTAKVESPPGYPVVLRLLREIDIVKIMANAFKYDLKCDAVRTLSESDLAKLFDELESSAEPSPVDAMVPEDIYELEEYVGTLHQHPMAGSLGEYYWSRADKLVPRLRATQRARALAPLWGEIEQLTTLYLELKAPLDALGHSERVFAPLSAIVDRQVGKTILHVETMVVALSPGSFSEHVTIVASNGASGTFRKSIVTALGVELTLQLQSSSWRFFENSDLLDFPGAKRRHDKRREEYFPSGEIKHPLGELFLRGKVAVMFDNYTAEFDLNTLLACHKPEATAIQNYNEMIQTWAYRTHGLTPAEREGKPVNLYMVSTCSDLLFSESAGGEIGTKISSRLSYLPAFNRFVAEWTVGKKFNNCYVVRSPLGARWSSMFNCVGPNDDWVEYPRPETQGLLDEHLSAFLSTDIARTYFPCGQDSWRAMSSPNDGGALLLASKLDETSDPDVKFDQIAPKAMALADELRSCLEPFYERADIEQRVRLRVGAIEQIVAILAPQSELIPALTSEFQVSREIFRQQYLDFRRARLFGGAGTGRARVYGQSLIELWSGLMFRRCDSERLAAAYGLSSEHMRTIASELLAGANVANMASSLDALVNRIEGFSLTVEQNADQIGTLAALLVGEFVSSLGTTGHVKLPDATTTAPDANAQAFDTRGMPIFPARVEEARALRETHIRGWLTKLLAMTRLNASSSAGSIVNVEENARLGGVLQNLSEALRINRPTRAA